MLTGSSSLSKLDVLYDDGAQSVSQEMVPVASTISAIIALLTDDDDDEDDRKRPRRPM